MPEAPAYPGKELTARNLWLVKLRWVAAAATLVYSQFASRVLGLASLPILGLGALIAFYNLIFLAVLQAQQRRPERVSLRWMLVVTNLQIGLDLLVLAVLVHLGGGVENPLLLFFVFHMVIASMLLSATASYVHATWAAVLVAAVAASEYAGRMPHLHPERLFPTCLARTAYAVLSGAAVVVALYVTVFLASAVTGWLRAARREQDVLAEQLRRKGDELQQAYDKLAAAQQTQAVYMRRVSHELRSPLTAVESLLAVISEGLVGDLAPRQQQMLARAKDRVAALLKTVDDLLLLSRSREAKLPAQLESVNVAHVAERVMSVMEARARSKNVSLTLQADDRLSPIMADPEAIEQLLTNLTANAIKYTPEGGSVTVSLGQTPQGSRIAVSDTGIGIDPDEQELIFQEFYRTKRARQFAGMGTGLGLSIAKAVVDAHRGTLSVTSTPGQGSTFEVLLPARPPGPGRQEPRR